MVMKKIVKNRSFNVSRNYCQRTASVNDHQSTKLYAEAKARGAWLSICRVLVTTSHGAHQYGSIHMYYM